MSLFQRITDFLDAELTPMQVLVALALEADGPCPKGTWADAWGCSVRTIEVALKAARQAGVSPAKNSSHDDRRIEHGKERGAAQEVAQPAADPAELTDADPLVVALRAEGIFPGAAVNLLKSCGRERVARQLDHHAERKAAGWAFKLKGQPVEPGHYLRLAILGDWSPMWTKPAGLVQAEAQREAERAARGTLADTLGEAAGADASRQAIAGAVAAVADAPRVQAVPTPQPTRQASREAVLRTLARCAASPVAPMRTAAIREALRVGLDPLAHGFRADEVAAVRADGGLAAAG